MTERRVRCWVAVGLVSVLSACSPQVSSLPKLAPSAGWGAAVLWGDGSLLGRLPAQNVATPSGTDPPSGGVTGALLAEVAAEATSRGLPATALTLPGTVIRTTLDRTAEQMAERATVRTELLDGRKRLRAGLIVVKPSTGEIVAAAGTADDGRLLASTPEQTGSVFKVFTLLAAAQAGIPLTARFDARSPTTLRGGAVISNFSADPSPAPVVTLETATAHSLNVVFARLAVDQLGLPSVIAAAHAAGIPSTVTLSAQDPFTSLGNTPMAARDVAGAYATVASGGLHCPVHLIASSTAAGLVPLGPCKRVFKAAVVAQTTQALRSVVEGGTGRRAKLPGRIVVGKTGTAQGNLSALFAGSTGDLTAVAVVVGSRQRPLRDIAGLSEVTGSSLPTDLWRTFVNAYLNTPQPGRSP
ncbi:MAG: penicillin-binding protein [Phycicoccus sp.]|nr:penicillin-binding protein [Phycicoccus sp.]